MDGIKTVTENESVHSYLHSSVASFLSPGLSKRPLPGSHDLKDILDVSSESYEHLTSPDGSSKSKRSRYSVISGSSNRQRSKFYHSGKHKKKRRRSYSGDLNHQRDCIRSECYRERSEPMQRLPETNRGHQMLMSMGWKPGTGLGASNSGVQDPVVISSQTNKKGFGYFA